MVEIEHTQDLEALRKIAIEQDRSIKSLLRNLHQLKRENLSLMGLDVQQLDLDLVIDVDNSQAPAEQTSENQGPCQEEPTGADGQQDSDASEKSEAPKRRTGRTPQSKLPQVSIKNPLEPERCEICNLVIEPFDSWDSSQTVTVTRTVYSIVSEECQKGRCGCPDLVHTAPSQILKMRSGGRYSVQFTAHVAVAKWADHLPLERQARSMARLGLEVTSNTLADQTTAMAEELRPCYQALHEAILCEPVLGMDETGWKLMGSDGRDYRAVIAMSSPSASIFHIADGKSTAVLRPLLDPFSGTIVVDGYKPYLAIVKERDDLLLANCWAHAVRRFKAAAKDFPSAEIPLKLIGKLYEIDRRAGPFPGDEEVRRRRQRLRKKESTVVLRSLRRWLTEQLPKVPKRTNLGNAIAYTLAHWQGLIVFVDDPKVPLDNNGTERDLRQVVQGRKNHYGSRSDRGLETAAILYSLIQTCLKIGVDPEKYLIEATRARRLAEPRTLLPADLSSSD